MAITGTATRRMRSGIVQQLAMGTNAVTINISPNRANIRFTVVKTSKDNQLGHLGWIVDLIKEHNLATPKTIIFCGTMHDVAKVIGFLLAELGNAAYVSGNPPTPENRLLGIFHSMTWPKYKARVSQSFKENVGHVRVVIATSALSMGVNFPDVQYVVHMGPARSVVDHIQEAGRAGRNGASAHNVVLFHGNQLAHCEKPIKEFARSDSCIRKALFKDFEEVPCTSPLHDCCSNCNKACLCSGTECNRGSFPFDEPKGKETVPTVTCERVVSDDDKHVLHEALCEIRNGLDSSTSFMFNSSSAHGFTSKLVDDLVQNASSVFSLSDLLKRFPIFNIGHAKLVLEIFQEIFEDIQGFDEMMATIEPEELDRLLPEDDIHEELLSSGSDTDPDRINSEELENL